MSNATTTTLSTGQSSVVEARHWIERQLRWERTLDTLRDHRSGRSTPAKAA